MASQTSLFGSNAVRMGVIGTAGRQDDAAKLSFDHYARMLATAEAIAAAYGVTDLVSGGAAWADHVAVGLVRVGTFEARRLTLHMPAKIDASGRFDASRDGSTANHYHDRFRARAGIASADDLAAVVAGGATTTVSGGFLARNALVARDAVDVLVAFTFGQDGEPWAPVAHDARVDAASAGLKDGGTAHTWTRCRAHTKIHVRLV